MAWVTVRLLDSSAKTECNCQVFAKKCRCGRGLEDAGPLTSLRMTNRAWVALQEGKLEEVTGRFGLLQVAAGSALQTVGNSSPAAPEGVSERRTQLFKRCHERTAVVDCDDLEIDGFAEAAEHRR